MSFAEMYAATSGLGDAYSKGLEEARKRELLTRIGGSLQSGSYGDAAKSAFDAGELNAGIGLLKLGEDHRKLQAQEQASAAFSAGLGGLYGADAAAAATSAPTQVPARSGPSFTMTDGAIGDYLATTRARESGGNDLAANPNSTAKGRYQFTDETWAGVARRHPDLGLQPGGWRDPAQQEKAMVAFTGDNAKALTAAGLPINPGNLYGSHFLGEAGGPKFIRGALNEPDAPAVKFVSSGAANANRSVFFNRDGTPKTASQVYSWMGGARGERPDQRLADAPAEGAQPASFQIPEGASDEAIGNAPVPVVNRMQLGQRIPFLLRAASLPNLPDSQRQLAQTLLTRALDETKLPDEQKDYLLSRSQGFTGSFLDYKRALKSEAGPLSVAPGNTLVDRNTFQPVYTAPDRDKSAENERKGREEAQGLRKEIQGLQSFKNYEQALPVYQSMLDAAPRNSKAADLNLVYGLGKIMDPGSVVREGEMVMVKNTGSLPDWLVGTINGLNGGQVLQPETRQAILQEAFSRMQSYEGALKQETERYRGIAGRSGMSDADVLPNFKAIQPYTPPAKTETPKFDRSALEAEARRRGLLK